MADNGELHDLGLPTVNDIKDEFENLADRLGVRQKGKR